MARHANFAVVASFRADEVNRRLAAAMENLGPFFFPLPQVINVGQTPVAFGGFATIAAPILEFHPNPQNLITAHFAFFSTFSASVDGNVSPNNILGGQSVKWHIRLDVTTTAGVILGPQNGQIMLSVDMSTVTIQPLRFTFFEGPRPPAKVRQALESQDLADAATAAVRLLGVIPLVPLVPVQLVHTQPLDIEATNFSVFNWFIAILTVSRTELVVMEDAVTIAADFAGITNGDRNALVDLTRTHGGGQIYIKQTLYDDRYPNGIVPTRPEPTWYGENADYAFTLNLEVLRSVIERQVSPQVSGTPIFKGGVLNDIQMSYGQFNPDKDIAGPYPRKDDGLMAHLHVTAYGIRADVVAYLQPYWEAGKWRMYVGRVDVNLPWWADFLLAVAGALFLFLGLVTAMILSVVSFGSLFPAFTKSWDMIFEGLNFVDPTRLDKTAYEAFDKSAQSAIFPSARYVSISPVGITVISKGGFNWEIAGGSLDAGFGRGVTVLGPIPVEPGGGAVITPTGDWSVYDLRPIRTAVQLSPTWMKLNRNNLFAVWEVRRKDTNAVVVTGVNPYNAIGGNGVDIPHHSEALYTADEFIVRCSLTMLLNNQAGEIWSGQTTIKIQDDMRRDVHFVEWGPGLACFYNEGTHNEWWKRTTRSRIHRTAVGARCKYLRVAVMLRKDEASLSANSPLRSPPLRYMDTLPFNWETLNDHRKELCEYCFFGGPTRTAPLPREDWFDPNPLYAKKHHKHVLP